MGIFLINSRKRIASLLSLAGAAAKLQFLIHLRDVFKLLGSEGGRQANRNQLWASSGQLGTPATPPAFPCLYVAQEFSQGGAARSGLLCRVGGKGGKFLNVKLAAMSFVLIQGFYQYFTV